MQRRRWYTLAFWLSVAGPVAMCLGAIGNWLKGGPWEPISQWALVWIVLGQCVVAGLAGWCGRVLYVMRKYPVSEHVVRCDACGFRPATSMFEVRLDSGDDIVGLTCQDCLEKRHHLRVINAELARRGKLDAPPPLH